MREIAGSVGLSLLSIAKQTAYGTIRHQHGCQHEKMHWPRCRNEGKSNTDKSNRYTGDRDLCR